MAGSSSGSGADPSSVARSRPAIRRGRTRIRGGARPPARGRPIGETGPVTTEGRLRLTGYAALQLVLSVVALVLFVLDVVAALLAVVVIGVPVLMVTLPASRW